MFFATQRLARDNFYGSGSLARYQIAPMNPNDPDVSRALAKLMNTSRMEPTELMDLARGAKDFKELRKKYADSKNFFLRDIPQLP